MEKERVDILIVKRGLAESRQQAQALVMAGLVFSGTQRIDKSSHMIETDKDLNVKDSLPYVSRGGLKLREAIQSFQFVVSGKTVADLGASTGGFSDCLLQHGANKIYAVDVDIRQLDWRLRNNSRIVPIQKNARYLRGDDFHDVLDLVTIDLSFISVLKVLPSVKEFLTAGEIICLIKPQFEAERRQVGKKGIIRDLTVHEEVLNRVAYEARKIGFDFQSAMKPSVKGQKGNQEYFILWSSGKLGGKRDKAKTLIKEIVWNEKD